MLTIAALPPGFWVAVIVIVVIAFVVLYYVGEKKRSEAFQAHAEENGWSFAAKGAPGTESLSPGLATMGLRSDDAFLKDYECFQQFQVGTNLRVSNCLTKTETGQDWASFELRYDTYKRSHTDSGNRESRQPHHEFYFSVTLPIQTSHIYVSI
jgi:hypothetical protein